MQTRKKNTKGVYEPVIFQMKPAGPALWGDEFKTVVDAHVDLGYTELVGVLHPEYRAPSRVHVLWWNESADIHAAGDISLMRTSHLWSLGKRQLPSVTAKYASDSYVIFTVEISFCWNMKHFINCSKMCLQMGLDSPKRVSLLFEGGGKLISYVPWTSENHLCPLSQPLQEILLFISPTAFQYLLYVRNSCHYFMILVLHVFRNNSPVFWQPFAL